jgi:4-alpha-glucanotransferase
MVFELNWHLTPITHCELTNDSKNAFMVILTAGKLSACCALRVDHVRGHLKCLVSGIADSRHGTVMQGSWSDENLTPIFPR